MDNVVLITYNKQLLYNNTKVTMSILDYWTHTKSPPRPAQIETLNWIEANQDKKYLFCDLPVGAGKSHVPVTMSNWLRDGAIKPTSFILTPQKLLQKQYEDSFELPGNIITSLYGKANYRCHNKNTSCNIGSMLNPKCGNCPHNAVKIQAKSSCNVVLNYKLALTLFNYTSIFEPRSLLALDESHNIESFLTEFNSANILFYKCEQLNIKWCFANDLPSVLDWVHTTYFPAIEKIGEIYADECEYLLDTPVNSLTQEDQKLIQKFHAMNEHIAEIDQFIRIPLGVIKDKFVLIKDKTQIKFKHLYGKENFHKLIKPFGDQILFMSATINYEETCKNLDIPLEETAHISVASDFPAENRPVIFIPTLKMNYQWMDDSNRQGRSNMIQALKAVAENHAEHNGIIHAGNYQIATWLFEQLDGKIPHMILHHNPDSGTQRDKVIDAFNNIKTPTLLISPSITEGLDLVGDKARFAIIAKVPFGSLGDAWIKKRMELSSDWYLLTALTDILQGCGRVVRSKDDWGSVYILDASWEYLYRKTSYQIPDWWKQGYQA
jgi:hypothetical protein